MDSTQTTTESLSPTPIEKISQVTQQRSQTKLQQSVQNSVMVQQTTHGGARVDRELMALYNQLSPTKNVDGRWPYSLLTLLKSVLQTPTQEMYEKEWTAVLGFFNKNRGGLFDVGHIMRFGDNWPGSEIEFTLYRRLIWLCCETCDPRTRATNIKTINLTRSGEGLSDMCVNRIIGYYN